MADEEGQGYQYTHDHVEAREEVEGGEAWGGGGTAATTQASNPFTPSTRTTPPESTPTGPEAAAEKLAPPPPPPPRKSGLSLARLRRGGHNHSLCSSSSKYVPEVPRVVSFRPGPARPIAVGKSVRNSRDNSQQSSQDNSHEAQTDKEVSPFKTPPLVAEEGWVGKESYFDPRGQEEGKAGMLDKGKGKEEALPIPGRAIPILIPSPVSSPVSLSADSVRRNWLSASRVFEDEVRAAMEGRPGKLNFERISREERLEILGSLGGYSSSESAGDSPVLDLERFMAMRHKGRHASEGSGDVSTLDLREKRSVGGGCAEKHHAEEQDKDTPLQLAATTEAHQLVRAHTQRLSQHSRRKSLARGRHHSDIGITTPGNTEASQNTEEIRSGVLSNLLKLYNAPSAPLSVGSPPASGASTPKWYSKSRNSSTTSLVGSGNSSQTLMAPEAAGGASGVGSPGGWKTPKFKMRSSSSGLGGLFKNIYAPKPNMADEIRITIHIAELLSRQKYVLKLCRALMLYGVSTGTIIIFRGG